MSMHLMSADFVLRARTLCNTRSSQHFWYIDVRARRDNIQINRPNRYGGDGSWFTCWKIRYYDKLQMHIWEQFGMHMSRRQHGFGLMSALENRMPSILRHTVFFSFDFVKTASTHTYTYTQTQKHRPDSLEPRKLFEMSPLIMEVSSHFQSKHCFMNRSIWICSISNQFEIWKLQKL